MYKNLWESSSTQSSNMASIIGYYSAVLFGCQIGTRTKAEIEEALAVGEFIWEHREEKDWTVREAKECLEAMKLESGSI